MTDATPPQWLDDPAGRHEYRYWDGSRWTEHVSTQNRQGTDPLVASFPPPAPGQSAPAAQLVRQPEVPAVVHGAEPLVLAIGDIGVSRSWVSTPNGAAPLRGSQWIQRDMTRTTSSIPTWAVVCAILFALFCLLGLLFLLVKEYKTSGYVEVSVQSGTLFHVTQIPVFSPVVVDQTRAQVYQAQTMAAAAPALDWVLGHPSRVSGSPLAHSPLPRSSRFSSTSRSRL